MANKTNALRILDQKKISYTIQEYAVDESDLSGVHAAEVLNQNPDQVFKTLVLQTEKKGYLVCCIPVNKEIDLKKLAKVSRHKKVEMIPMKDLLSITGYIRGGCSPIGMKKQYPTYFHSSASQFDVIYLSAGKRGLQMVVNPKDITSLLNARIEDVVK